MLTDDWLAWSLYLARIGPASPPAGGNSQLHRALQVRLVFIGVYQERNLVQ